MSTGDIGSIENKCLLWSILIEESIFNGIGQESTPHIINIFETAINTVKNTRTDNANNSANLATMNKEVIRRIIPEIVRYKASATSSAPVATDTNYKAADMQEARIRDITSKLKIHEDDMNSFLVLKKPAEINFADSKTDDDRPIGNEMDQLIQAALASRARELEILQIQPPPILTQTDEPTYTDKRTVSFSNDSAATPMPPIIKNADSISAFDAIDAVDIDTIVNKFKRSGDVGGNKPNVPPNSNAALSEILESLRKLNQTVAEIQRDVRELNDKIKQ
jgi:hypothetical protein